MKATVSGIVMLAMFFSFAGYAHADGNTLSVENGYVYLPMKGSSATAAYGKLKNNSKSEVTLSIVGSNAFKATELHETVTVGEAMKMQKLESVKIAQGGSLDLAPGGNHIMLFEGQRNFKENDLVEIEFLVSGKKEKLAFKMKPRGASGEEHKHHH